MLSNPSPEMMPVKAYKNLSKTAMKAASADPAMADEADNEISANSDSADPSSVMNFKPYEDLSNPQGNSLFSPF